LFRRSLRLGFAITAVALFAALLGASAASASELVSNGGFDTGTLEGWQTVSQTGAGEWFTFSRKEQEEEGLPPFPPASGEFAAADEFGDPDTAILFQEVTLPAASTDELSMNLSYKSQAPLSTPVPNTLVIKGLGGKGNQQLRVDILKAGAPIETISPENILATVFATETGSPEVLAPTVVKADLTPFAGQKVVLRIANAVEVNFMETVVDNVSVTSTLLPPVIPPQTTPPPPPPPPSNVFTKGKLTLNKKTGTGTLAVTVPDAGTLTATDVHSKIALASFAKTKGTTKAKPVYVKSATVDSTGAGTVKVPIKPTAAAKKVLAKQGKLSVNVQLTFAPTGGTAASQSFKGALLKTLKPAPR
jgi:hypothetical protein